MENVISYIVRKRNDTMLSGENLIKRVFEQEHIPPAMIQIKSMTIVKHTNTRRFRSI